LSTCPLVRLTVAEGSLAKFGQALALCVLTMCLTAKGSVFNNPIFPSVFSTQAIILCCSNFK